MRFFIHLCVFFFGLFSAYFVLAQDLPALGRAAENVLSPAAERALGVRVMQDIRRQADYLEDAAIQEYLQDFGLRFLVQANIPTPENFVFFAMRSASLNAFALPGGFIGVHTGLLLAAQSESEIAGVLAHEIGHVTQRHIARMIGQQKQDTMLSFAALLVGALAMGTSPDLGAAVIAGGSAASVHKQLYFSRDMEREADRIGLAILQKGGFDTSGILQFFTRLSQSTRHYALVEQVSPYLMTHPLTTERQADIRGRLRDQPYRQHLTHPDFYLIQARARVLQANSPQALEEAGLFFRQQKAGFEWAAHYGLALIALKRQQLQESQAHWENGQKIAKKNAPNRFWMALGMEIASAMPQPKNATDLVHKAIALFPVSRAVSQQYVRWLMAVKEFSKAVTYLRTQMQTAAQDPQLQELLASIYAAQGKEALQQLALAQAAQLRGGLVEALQHLKIAQQAKDASFHDHVLIDALERLWKAEKPGNF